MADETTGKPSAAMAFGDERIELRVADLDQGKLRRDEKTV